MAIEQNPNHAERHLKPKQLLVALGAFFLLTVLGGAALAATAIPAIAAAGTATNALTHLFEDVPTDIDFTQPSEQSRIVASDGSLIANFYAENRIVVDSESISPLIKDAAVSIEDERFYEHNGVDAQGIIGAAINNVTGGNLAGGSSITQQYVKNALIEEGRINDDNVAIAKATETSLARKLNEARFAIALENKLTKDEILTAYLNIAQFGPSQWGVESASRYFFGVSAKDVTLPQAAMLAGVTQAPARWDPVKNPEDAKIRRDVVLGKMKELGYITAEDYDAAVNTSIEDMLNVTPASNGCEMGGNAAFFCETVVADLLNSNAWGKDRQDRVNQLYRGGLTIVTTLDRTKQDAAYDAVIGGVPIDDQSSVEASIASVEPGTGKVLAMVQNTRYGSPEALNDPDATKVNLNVDTTRGGGSGFQAGSTFKVFTLVDWIKQGHNQWERLSTSPRTFPRNTWTISCAPELADQWPLGNSGGVNPGIQSVRNITANSYNVGYANMAAQLDLCDISKTASAMGAENGQMATADQAAELAQFGAVEGRPLPFVPRPTFIIGTENVTPLSMANAYATLAAEGMKCETHTFTEIQSSNGDVIATQEPECDRVIDREVALEVTDVLRAVTAPGGSGSAGGLGDRPVAGKTGTTDESWHAWFAGFVPQVSTAVWMGHSEGNIPMRNVVINGQYYRNVFGGTVVAPIFRNYMSRAMDGVPVEQFERSSIHVEPPRPAPRREERDDSDEQQEQPADTGEADDTEE
ncbi:MAG: penicillin-binding protein [Arcanobacterium sp.]|nr:penicillin-binding protein [Arcanobacterium sp.]